MTFPPTGSGEVPHFLLRTNAEWRQMVDRKDTSKGVKGQCELLRLSYVDMPTICPPETMHSQYLGILSLLLLTLNLIFPFLF